VVKFAERYNKRAHEIMVKAIMAADLLYCAWEQTVGLWVVIMKYYDCDPKAPLSEADIKQLETGLQKLHSKNLVHGDIRRPNTLVDANGHPRLIDFDWSGEVGQAWYPAHLNGNLGWPMHGCQNWWIDSAGA
jgi:Protein kinase domain